MVLRTWQCLGQQTTVASAGGFDLAPLKSKGFFPHSEHRCCELFQCYRQAVLKKSCEDSFFQLPLYRFLLTKSEQAELNRRVELSKLFIVNHSFNS